MPGRAFWDCARFVKGGTKGGKRQRSRWFLSGVPATGESRVCVLWGTYVST